MELRHIQYFVAVAEELHFGRAAKRVHISQPPLSQQIKQLEDELGTPLFTRSKRKVELTPAGIMLLPEARALLAQAQQCQNVVRLSALGDVGTLRIGYVEEAVHFVFPYVLNAFQARYPNVKVQLIEMHSNDQADALERGTIDFGFGYSQSDDKTLGMKRVLKGQILLALPEKHPLADHASIDLSKCAGQNFIFPVRSSSPHLFEFLRSICHANDLEPDIAYTAEHIYTVMGFVRSGLGVTLFPDFLKTDEWRGIVFRKLRGRRYYLEMLALWNKNHANWPMNRNFIKLLQEY